MKAKECCGLVGICADTSVSRKLFFGLKVIQHRGQEAAGIAVSDGTKMRWHKDAGLVHEVFDKDILDELEGNVGIAHIRYSTTGMKTADEAHPIMAKTTRGDIAVCHNGELSNAEVLRDHFRKKGAGLEGLSDTELIVRILAGELENSTDPTRAISRTLGKIKGAYSLAILIGDRLFAARDPHGIRPLCLGKMQDGHVIASETPVLDLLEAELVKDVKPGEIVEVGTNMAKSYQIPTPRHTAHCMFEYVYFSRPDNCLDGQLVYDVRRRIGEILAVESQTEADAVFPVPDSGRAHAAGYADGSVIPMAEGLIKNRFVERTFILPEQRDRELSVLLKLNPVTSLVEDQRIVVVKAGAKEVHVRIGCPPVRHPCYLGIDMKTREQFVANEKDEKQIAKELGADSLVYISVEGLVEAIGFPMDDLCCGCLIGEYPVPIELETYLFRSCH
jgi:amidophosphoribosyltransferase